VTRTHISHAVGTVAGVQRRGVNAPPARAQLRVCAPARPPPPRDERSGPASGGWYALPLAPRGAGARGLAESRLQRQCASAWT